MANPLVGIIMGSKTDLEVLNGAVEILKEFGIEHEVRVLSAHRTPEQVLEWSSSAESRGLEVLIAGAGGAAHLPGVVAAKTVLPVLGVPVPSTTLGGADALLSIVQMPKGIPVGTLAIGKSGAANAALLAIAILSGKPSADLDAHRQPFGGGQHRGAEAAAARQLLVELAQRRAAVVAAWPVDLAEAERVVRENHSSFAKVVGGPGEIAGVAHLVGIDEDQIEWRFRLDLAQHLQRGSDMDVRA